MKYLKLGPKAKSFSDPYSGVVISGKEIIEVTNPQVNSPKVAAAIRGNHLEISNESDFQAWKKSVIVKESEEINATVSDRTLAKENKKLKSEKASLNEKIEELEEVIEELELKIENLEKELAPVKGFPEMSDTELIDYYNNTFEVTKKDLVIFTEMGNEDKVKFLTNLETEE